MKSSALLAVLLTATVFAEPAAAGGVDMDDPHRAVGRESDVRVDAQLLSDVVRAGAPISVTYQIQNLTEATVAVAEKIAEASYDSDSRTIVLAVGSEIPPDGAMPRMATIAPGEKKTFTTATTLRVGGHSRVVSVPRYVQIKVNVLRNLEPFIDLLKRQQDMRAVRSQPLSDHQFEEWLEGNDTILLNTLPIRFQGRVGNGFDASQRHRRNGAM